MTTLQTKVLICGAGPTGLMMACQLKRFGIDCIIIDPKQGIVKESRALALQARTLQIYEQMGLAGRALEQGTAANKIKIIINGHRLYEVPLQQLGKGQSAYAFLFILEQNKNEKILYDHLKELQGDVLWEHSIETFTQTTDGVSAIIVNRAGEKVQINAGWLVGADGAKSQVRHQLNIPFKGGTYENIFIVADTFAEWPWGHDCLSLCLTANGFAGLFPMKGDNRFRLIGTFPKQFIPSEVTDFAQIQKVVQEQIKIDVNFRDTNWFSIYHVHHRSVNSFTHGKIFLAGDAAHVHSPAGGQGMNTGLQDAYNLAWKLALVVNKQADKGLLNSYNEERLPVAKRLVKTTDRAFSIVTSDNWFLKILRLNIVPPILSRVLSIKRFGQFAYRTVSQIGIEYSKSLLSYSESNNLLQAGHLVPFVNINSKVIDEHLKFNGFTIFLFDITLTDEQRGEIQNLFLVKSHFINIKREEINENAFKKFKVTTSALFLIRPDNYIGFASENIPIENLKKYLRERLRLIASSS
jgi:2-polyprenyl-6-methoxyphenol hydroxylase-like FAD-dependent oxidoreductase